MSRHIDESALSRRAAVGAIIGSAISAAGLATSGCGTTVAITPPRPPPIPPAPPRQLPVPPPTPVKVPRRPEPAKPPRLVSRLKPVYDCTSWLEKPGGLVPGTERAFITDRAWRTNDHEACAPYDAARWERYLMALPTGAFLIVNEECLKDSPMYHGRDVALLELPKRLELHRVVRRLRPDVINTDVCGPLPQSDQSGPIWNDPRQLRRCREANDLTMPFAPPSLLRALTIEVYFTPRPDKPVRATYHDDVAAVMQGNAAEARRHAQGRPIHGLVYLRSKGGRAWGEYFGDDLARFMLDEAARVFDGIVIWDNKFTPDGKDLGRQRYDPTDPALALTLRWLRERDR